MKYDQTSKQLSAYFDAELDVESTESIRLHLEHCSDCSQQLSWFRRLRLEAGKWSADEEPSWSPSWAAIEQRMNGMATFSSKPWQRKEVTLRQMGVVLTLAASIVLFVRFSDSTQSTRQPLVPDNIASIDFQDVINRCARDPQAAVESLSNQYAGLDVTLADVEVKLGYRPLIFAMAADDVQLVSTKLLQFPNCSGSAIDSKIEPRLHNCVACICQRNDGSRFLVVEHCHRQDVSFGKLAKHWFNRDGQPLQLLMLPKSVTASWEANEHRVTAIGLHSHEEANALYNASQIFDEA